MNQPYLLGAHPLGAKPQFARRVILVLTHQGAWRLHLGPLPWSIGSDSPLCARLLMLGGQHAVLCSLTAADGCRSRLARLAGNVQGFCHSFCSP